MIKKAKKMVLTRYNNNKNIIFIKSKKIDIYLQVV